MKKRQEPKSKASTGDVPRDFRDDFNRRLDAAVHDRQSSSRPIITVRLSKELHESCKRAAAMSGVSVNRLATLALESVCEIVRLREVVGGEGQAASR